MHTITIYGDALAGLPVTSTEYSYPGAWSEVTAAQLVDLAQVLAATEVQAISRFLLLEKLAGIPAADMAIITAEDVTVPVLERINDEPFDHRTEVKWHLLPSLDWCYERPVNRTSLLPAFEHGGKTWTGPGDRLGNFTLNRFAWCDSLLSALSGNPEPELIDQFMAALHQPQGEEWTNLRIEEYALLLADLPPSVKLTAILNYRALRGHLTETFWRVFQGGDEAPLESGLFGTIYDVCASGLFGDIDHTEQQQLLRVMGYMQHQLEKDERNATSTPAT